ncbi:MAG: serine/threonine protein kinase [Akkermansia sp.]|nr:serine/threonine protein kinase [Akkermansia sp.]MBQ8376753.1 serine/threonine protein kinase [Akkermansia sp.]
MASAQAGAALPLRTSLGHCEIRGLLGQGGGGISYLAYDAHLEREVVIKEHFPPTLCFRVPGTAEVQPVSAEGYERSLAAFCREARILAGLNHPGVVKVYDIFQASGTAYMVMEYVEGERLAEWLPTHAAEVSSVIGVLKLLLASLEYLHTHEVLHRDIKPSNIIIRGESQPVLIDFGAAMLGTPPTTITMVGTPGYAAPEQFQQHGQVGPWSDLYALAHSFAKHIPERALRRYPRRFVRSLHKAGMQHREQRYSQAAEWLKLLEMRDCGSFRLLLFVCFILGGLCVAAYFLCESISPSGECSVSAGEERGKTGELHHDLNGAVSQQEELNRFVNQADSMSPQHLKAGLQELKHGQNEKMRNLADKMNRLYPLPDKQKGWVVLPGQGDVAEEAEKP